MFATLRGIVDDGAELHRKLYTTGWNTPRNLIPVASVNIRRTCARLVYMTEGWAQIGVVYYVREEHLLIS